MNKIFNNKLTVIFFFVMLMCRQMCYCVFLQYLASRGYNKTLLMEEVLQRYLGDELAERKKIHEEEMKELSKSVLVTHPCTHSRLF